MNKSEKKLYLVEAVSIFRMRYVFKAESATDAEDELFWKHDSLKELSQEHISEEIFSTREISKKEYIELFDKDNEYAKDWTEEKKKQCINKVKGGA